MKHILACIFFCNCINLVSQTNTPDFLKEFKKEFDSLVVKGDSCFYHKNYQTALSFYINAIQTEPMYLYDCSDSYCLKFKEELNTANKKYNLIIELLWNETLSSVSGDSTEKYKKYVQLGDQYLGDSYNKFERPIQAYLRANNIFPDEKYPLAQIKKITKSLYREEDTLKIISNVISANCNYLLNSNKYNETESYIKNQKELLNNYYINKKNSLQEKSKNVSDQLNKTKRKEVSEINILQQQFTNITQEKALLDSNYKSVLETCAIFLDRTYLLRNKK